MTCALFENLLLLKIPIEVMIALPLPNSYEIRYKVKGNKLARCQETPAIKDGDSLPNLRVK